VNLLGRRVFLGKQKIITMKKIIFLSLAGLVALILALSGSFTSCASGPQKFEGHHFPELGYSFDALEPYIDAQTMEIHYTKHHRGYYDNFMKAAEEMALLQTPLEEIMKNISKYSEVLRNNAGGYYNHNLFWANMTPDKKEVPAELKAAIEKDFGSWDAFTGEFGKAAKSRFGSGWAWLSVDPEGKLFVSSTPNQDNPLMDVAEKRGIPVLGLDVWEHAYYLKYQNRRAEYVEKFWNIIDWQAVADRYAKAVK
jgi:Fe-Mn family superoxide dismutase